VNVSELVSAYLIDKNVREGEERLPFRLHVSDIANGCTRAVWHRIHNGLTNEFTSTQLKKFAFGHAWERVVEEALVFAGYEIIVDEMVEMDDGVIGHGDILAVNADTRHLIEVKTTMLFRNGGRPPVMYTRDELREQQRQYIIQPTRYAKHYACDTFTLHLIDRGTGIDGDFEFVTAEEWPYVKARSAQFKLLMELPDEPDALLPQWTRNAKGVSYICKTCPVLTCSQNPNYTAARSA